MTDQTARSLMRVRLVSVLIALGFFVLALTMTLIAQSAREETLAHRSATIWATGFNDQLVPTMWDITGIFLLALAVAIIFWLLSKRSTSRKEVSAEEPPRMPRLTIVNLCGMTALTVGVLIATTLTQIAYSNGQLPWLETDELMWDLWILTIVVGGMLEFAAIVHYRRARRQLPNRQAAWLETPPTATDH